jgi:hypothetical protein
VLVILATRKTEEAGRFHVEWDANLANQGCGVSWAIHLGYCGVAR